jgi:hypothetical protein
MFSSAAHLLPVAITVSPPASAWQGFGRYHEQWAAPATLEALSCLSGRPSGRHLSRRAAQHTGSTYTEHRDRNDEPNSRRSGHPATISPPQAHRGQAPPEAYPKPASRQSSARKDREGTTNTQSRPQGRSRPLTWRWCGRSIWRRGGRGGCSGGGRGRRITRGGTGRRRPAGTWCMRAAWNWRGCCWQTSTRG